MIQKKILVVAIAAVFAGSISFASYRYGHLKGFSAANAEWQAADIEALAGVIDEFKTLSKEAKAQSLVLSGTISARQVADQKSTQVFVNALNATAHLRFNCMFDDSIMQQFNQAADRADEAAATGFGNSVPTRTAPDG